MVELRAVELRVVRCLGAAHVLDVLDPAGGTSCRIAADELLLLEPNVVPRDAEQCLVVDHTDAFAAYVLTGDDVDEAFARLSAIRLPDARPAFLQGAVADVAAKVVADTGRILVLVSSSLGHHLRERALASCRDLGIVEFQP